MLCKQSAAIALFALFVSACGGSGGSGTGASVPPTLNGSTQPSADSPPNAAAPTSATPTPETPTPGTPAPVAPNPGTPAPVTPPPVGAPPDVSTPSPGTTSPTTPVTILPTPAAISFYDDEVLATWAQAGWNSSTDFKSATIPASSGSVSASVSFANAYGAFALANWNTPAVTSGYNAIALSVRGSTSPRFLELFVEGPNGVAHAATSLPDIAPGVWNEVVIYLSDLGLPNVIHRIGLANDSQRMDYTNVSNPEYNTPFFVDNLRLVKATLPPAPAAQTGPSLAVNVAADRRTISPEIYGVNWENQAAFAAEIKTPINRWGGDATSRFNYNTNNSNPGFNWYFANRNEGITPSAFVDFNRKVGSNTIMTLPMIGWAAKDATSCGYSLRLYGPQTGQAPDRADCGNGVIDDKTKVTANSATDTSVAASAEFYRPWIQSLVSLYGRADSGGIRYYNLDNEPGIWNGTHRDLIKSGITHTDLLARSIAAAQMLKSVDPSAKTLGPSEDGWTRYIISGRDTELGNYGALYDGLWAVEWYLKEMRAYESRTGTRLLDYLDLHYYPQAGGVYGGAGSKTLQAQRLRTVRSLWDPTYVDESWISNTGIQNVKLIPRMRNWISTHYPGTKLAITEYNFGALNHINGALTQADVLGVFGREGVDIATLWGPPETYAPDTGLFADKPGAFAMRMYRNYDGAGGQFGDTSVQSVSANQDKLSIYGSIDSKDGSLKIMVINKTDTPLTSAVTLQGFLAAPSVKVYRYSTANLAAIEASTLTASVNSVTATFAANSITLLRLSAGQ